MRPPRRRRAGRGRWRAESAHGGRLDASAAARARSGEVSEPPAHCDIAVVGAGIVGLAVARELIARNPRSSVCVLERESEVSRHQTGHNSGVIHAGIYYAPGSLKARLCVQGAREMYAYCESRDIPHARCGKVIVASGPSQIGALEELARRARANGVADVGRVSAQGLRELEPHARGVAALHSPGSGIVDYAAVARALADDVRAAGGTVALDCEVCSVRGSQRGLRLSHARGETRAASAVFCAGVWADRVARAAGADSDPRILPFRGAYLRLVPARTELVRALIYPVPDPSLPFLGVHFTRTVGGEVLVGPTALPAMARDPAAPTRERAGELLELLAWPGTWRMFGRWWRAGASELGHALVRASLVRAAARYVPELSTHDVRPAFTGMRAQAVARDGRLIDDFVFSRSERAVHVRSAPSPGATAALAIAHHVAEQVERWVL